MIGLFRALFRRRQQTPQPDAIAVHASWVASVIPAGSSEPARFMLTALRRAGLDDTQIRDVMSRAGVIERVRGREAVWQRW